MSKKITNEKIITDIQKGQMRDDHPDFSSGDTISVHLKIVEGAKTRVQIYTGVVLKVRGKNTSKTFIIRKDSGGIGAEMTFGYHSPSIIKIDLVKKGKVRRSYISYMRNRSGKAARIKEDTSKK